MYPALAEPSASAAVDAAKRKKRPQRAGPSPAELRTAELEKQGVSRDAVLPEDARRNANKLGPPLKVRPLLARTMGRLRASLLLPNLACPHAQAPPGMLLCGQACERALPTVTWLTKLCPPTAAASVPPLPRWAPLPLPARACRSPPSRARSSAAWLRCSA